MLTSSAQAVGHPVQQQASRKSGPPPLLGTLLSPVSKASCKNWRAIQLSDGRVGGNRSPDGRPQRSAAEHMISAVQIYAPNYGQKQCIMVLPTV